LKATNFPDQARLVLELVKPLKCCDPAVGSGAFPVGLMQELVNLRRLLETVLNGYRDPVLGPQGSSWLHDAKAEIVENCLYGVDIQQQAIEICRLRLCLSLVTETEISLNSGVEPGPEIIRKKADAPLNFTPSASTSPIGARRPSRKSKGPNKRRVGKSIWVSNVSLARKSPDLDFVIDL
jgi:hypothetical protein